MAPRWLAPILRITRTHGVFVRAVYGWRWSRRLGQRAWRISARPVSLALLVIVVVATVAASAIIGYRLWRVPGWILSGTTTADDAVGRIAAYRAAQASILGVLVQALGGLAIIAGLLFTWRQIRAGQEAQVSERYSRCVEQLGSDRVEVRVGGIEGLERIAFDRPAEFIPILRMLSAFVVERSNTWRSDHVAPKQLAALP